MVLDITEKERKILILSLCMSAVEGNYAYDRDIKNDDIKCLLSMLGAGKETVNSAGEFGWGG